MSQWEYFTLKHYLKSTTFTMEPCMCGGFLAALVGLRAQATEKASYTAVSYLYIDKSALPLQTCREIVLCSWRPKPVRYRKHTHLCRIFAGAWVIISFCDWQTQHISVILSWHTCLPNTGTDNSTWNQVTLPCSQGQSWAPAGRSKSSTRS